jgi:GntR family transcriptional regulator
MRPGTVTRPGSDEPGGSRSGQQQADHAASKAAPAAAAMGLSEQGLGVSCAPGSWPGRGDDRARRPVPSIEHGTTMTRTMFDVNLDRSGPAALHDQVAAQIRRAIADGEAGPGERLPLAKDLAAVLGVNKNTVLRALHILREEGLLEFRRGRGITVAGTPERGAVLVQVRNLLEFAGQQGYGRSEIIQMISDLPWDA